MATATEHIHDEVRELIRRRGVDPITDQRSARALIDEVVGALRGAGADLVAAAAARPGRRAVRLRLAGRASARCRRYLDDPTIEEIWVNQPGRVFVARQRPVRADHHRAVPRRGAGPGRTDAQAVRPAAGPVVAVRRRAAARRLPAARGDPRHHPASTSRSTSASSSSPPTVWRTWSRCGIDDRPRRAVPRGGGRRRAQHHRGRRHPGRQDHAAEHPDQLHPAAGAGDQLRGGVRARGRTCPTWWRCRPASPTWRVTARSGCAGWSRRRCGCGRRRIIVGEVRQEESLDLLIALNSGLPGMCSIHANSAREAVTKLCTLPLLAGENVTAGFVVPTVAASRRPGGAARASNRTVPAGPRDRRAARPRRGRRGRDRGHLHHPRRRAGPGAGLPAARRPVPAARHRPAPTAVGRPQRKDRPDV